MYLQRAYRTVRLCVFMHLMLVVAAPDLLLLLLLCFDFFVSHTHLVCLVCKVEPRGLIARRVTEVAQSTLDMVTTAVDYPLCEHCFFFFTITCSVGALQLVLYCLLTTQIFVGNSNTWF